MNVCAGLPYVTVGEERRKLSGHGLIAAGFKMDHASQNVLRLPGYLPVRRRPVCISSTKVPSKMDCFLLLNVLRFGFAAAAASPQLQKRLFLKASPVKLNENSIQYTGISQRQLAHGFMIYFRRVHLFSRFSVLLSWQ